MSVLHLSEVDFESAGQYWCKAVNTYGSDWSAVANVTVIGEQVILCKVVYTICMVPNVIMKL